MIAVQAEGLAKAYSLYARPVDQLLDRLLPRRGRPRNLFWALRDVSFTLEPGTTFGIIGENGSGKSTLLALVAGLLQPTAGTLTVRGRISTLLELGAGFNPAFTGRENALLGGAVLGLEPAELQRRLPDIIAFAELGEFIDRPARTYSSGMYVRLAFALATSVDPDVLVIDEVLAVGDQYFQKKCIDRIQAFRQAGKTILFCSHNLYLVKEICERALWLHQGRVAALGARADVADAYSTFLREKMSAPAPTLSRPLDSPAWITEVRLLGADGEPVHHVRTGGSLTLEVYFATRALEVPVNVGVHIVRNDNIECFGVSTHFTKTSPALAGHRGAIALRFPAISLLSGAYRVSVLLLDEHGLHPYEHRVNALEFTVTNPGREIGFCYLEHEWVTPDLSRWPLVP